MTEEMVQIFGAPLASGAQELNDAAVPVRSVGKIRQRLGKLTYLLPQRLRRQVLYLRFHHRLAQMRRPVYFSEKLQWRILHDRRELIGMTCDKLKSKAVAEAAGVRVPQTYWHGTDVRELANVALPEHWVLKPNHRCGIVHFGTGTPDIATLLDVTKGWLRDAQTLDVGEWGYSQAEVALLVEEALGDPGEPPSDYKIFVFDGEPKLVQVDSGRFTTRHGRRFYTAEWQPLDTRQVIPLGDIQPRPAFLADLLEAAGRLGAPFEFVRVDLYRDDDEVVFGEFSAYPGGGISPFSPRDLDLLLGTYWRLPVSEEKP
jgi:hypothetical protein